MPSVGRDGKYDCAILDVSGVEVGLTLAKDKNNKPAYREYTEEPLATQYSTTPDYGAFRPERELQIGQSDWRAGFGIEYFDKNDPKRYFYGINIDPRFRDEVRLAPLGTGIAIPATPSPTLTDPGFETWTSSTVLTNWTKESGSLAQSTDERSGVYAAKLNGSTTEDRIYADVVGYNASWNGRKITISGWYTAGTAAYAFIGLDDGVSTTYGNANLGEGGWTQFVSFSKVLSPNATRLRFYCKRSTTNTNPVWLDDMTIAAGSAAGAPTAMATFAGFQYTAFGAVLARLNATGDGWNGVYEFDNPITDLCVATVSGVDYLFICLGWGSALYYLASRSIENCEDRWDELIDTDVTSSVDTSDFKIGSGSVKLVVAAGCAAGDILATEVITSVNLTTYNALKLWVKSSVALDASDIQILLDDTAQCASPLGTLNISAISADTWTAVTLVLSTPSALTAVISIGVKMAVDKGAFTLRLNDIRAEGTPILSTLTSKTHKYMATIGTTFYGSDTNSTVVSTTAPLNGGTNWAGSKQIGEKIDSIVDLKAFGGLLYAKKQNGKTYYIDSSGNVQTLIGGATSTNTARMYVWRDTSLLIPYGKQGLIEFDGTYKTHISPSFYSSNASDFVGQVQAVTGDDQWLYVVLDDGTDVQIMATREEAVDGAVDWRWHPLITLALTNCSSADISSIYKKRLWVGSDTSSESFYYYPIPTTYGDLDADSDLTYQTGGYIITPWLHANFKGDKKAWYKITLTMADTTSAIYWRAYYQKLGDEVVGGVGWTEISSTNKFKTSPTTSAYLPVDSASAKPQSTMMRFKFEGVTGTTTLTPKLLNYDIRAIWYPPQRTLIEMIVKIKDKLVTKGYPTGDETQTSATIKSALDGLKSSTWPVAFYPPYYRSSADTKYVRLLTPSEYNVSVIHEDAERLEGVYGLLFEIVEGLSF